MRKCIRCDTEMIENFDVKVEGSSNSLKITDHGILQENLGRVRCAVCPECGYLEFYLEETVLVKEILKGHSMLPSSRRSIQKI